MSLTEIVVKKYANKLIKMQGQSRVSYFKIFQTLDPKRLHLTITFSNYPKCTKC